MEKMDLFAGLCIIENETHTMQLVENLLKEIDEFKDQINFTFKASFDKANRTSIESYRGPGLEEGLKILQKVKDQFSLPILTDFHYPEQAEAVAEVADTIQVPAFLCRQTDLVVAGAKAAKAHNCRLNIKKGQFLAPEDVLNIITKAASELPKEQIMLTERGSSFGYQNLLVDMASFGIMKSFGVKTIFDATHSVQRPGGLGTQTGGKREQIATLSRAAIAAGADGLFMEVHTEPEKALCDSATCLSVFQVKEIIQNALKIREALKEDKEHNDE